MNNPFSFFSITIPTPLLIIGALISIFLLVSCQTPKPQYTKTLENDYQGLSKLPTHSWTRYSSNSYVNDTLQHYVRYFNFPTNGFSAKMTQSPVGDIFTIKISPPVPKGQAVIIHGYMAHSGHHSELAQRLVHDGWEVILLDLPGHGISSGQRFHIDSFHHYGSALTAVWDDVTPGIPMIRLMIGHSTGASTIIESIKVLPQNQQPNGIIIGAPLIELYQRGIRTTLNQLAWSDEIKLPEIFRNPRFMSTGASCNPEFREFALLKDPLYSWIYAPGWLAAYDMWIEELLTNLKSLTPVPVLVLQGSGDTTVDGIKNGPLVDILFPNNKQITFEDYSHTIFNVSKERMDEVYKQIEMFLHFKELHDETETGQLFIGEPNET